MSMRKSRELYIGAEYHISARINRSKFILESKEIKELFLFTIARAKMKYSFKLHNFVIMSNHIHFLIKPGKDENLSRIMQWILSVFAINYNKFFNLKGHVWYDRFKSTVIKSYRQFLAAFKYISNNPIKVNLTDNPWDYEYGGLWHTNHGSFNIIDPPNRIIIG